MIFIVNSISGIPIRLTEERWKHIQEEHAELIDSLESIKKALEKPDKIFLGNQEERIAIKEIFPGKYVAAVYREQETEGFVITAFLTRRIRQLERKPQIWP